MPMTSICTARSVPNIPERAGLPRSGSLFLCFAICGSSSVPFPFHPHAGLCDRNGFAPGAARPAPFLAVPRRTWLSAERRGLLLGGDGGCPLGAAIRVLPSVRCADRKAELITVGAGLAIVHPGPSRQAPRPLEVAIAPPDTGATGCWTVRSNRVCFRGRLNQQSLFIF